MLQDYPDLYDVLFPQGTVDDAERAFISHFTLAGVSKSRSWTYSAVYGVLTMALVIEFWGAAADLSSLLKLMLTVSVWAEVIKMM